MGKIRSSRKLETIATEVRQLVIEMACRSRSAHVGSSLSCIDMLVALYFSEMNIDEGDWKHRDIFVLSKGHAAMALYATLSAQGLLSRKMLLGYLKNNGTLPAHLDRFKGKGIEVSAGSLGHGFNVGLGMAYGYQLKKDKRRVFALIGDGESEEGSIWEGALFAAKLGIDNFTALLDYNNLQGYGRPRELCHYEPVIAKWRSFGWDAVKVDGHDFEDILSALRRPRIGKPRILVADTTKGKGVHFMEDEMKWHYFIVTDELREQAMNSLCRMPDEK